MPSIEKVRVVLGAVHTSQNRAFLATVFACGLRIQEALHLEVYDIESQRTMVHAHRGKRPIGPLPKSTWRRLRTHDNALSPHNGRQPTRQRSEPSI